MTYILHIDTSAEKGTIMLAANGKVISQRVNTDARNHAANINIHIEEVVKEAGITLNDISAIAVCGGPGSYTGLRIGLATAKGLCYALDKPLLQHYKLLLLAVNQHYKFLSKYEYYISVLPAREKEYFISIYNDKLECITTPRHEMEDELTLILDEIQGKALLTGNIAEHMVNNSKINIVINQEVDIDSWAQYTFERYNCNDSVNLSSAEPFYLKDVYTHKSKKIN